MASGSASYSGRNVTVTVNYPAQLANYGGSGRNAVNRSIEIEGDGGGYVVIGSGYQGPMGGINSASYTWTYNYGSTHSWDSRGYYTDVNTGANGAYRDSCSGSVTMGAAPAPTAPATPGVYASQSGTNAIFTWDNVSASGYSYSGSASGSTTGTSITVAGSYGSTYSLSVQAYNQGDGVNTAGTSYSGTGSASVRLAYPTPAAPSTPTVSGSASGTNAVFSWTNVSATGYQVFINGSLYTTTASTSITIGSSLGANTSCYVQAYNSNPDATSYSGTSNTATVHIPNPPATPSVPNPLNGSVSGQTVTLSWANVGATGYNVNRNGSFLKQVTGATSTTDAGLTKGQTYTYTVSAFNTNSDGTSTSGVTNTVSEYVLNPPAAPAGTTLSATAHANGDGGVDLTWSAVSCTGYRVTRDGTQILDRAAASGTTFTDTGRTRGTSYSYVVTTYNTNSDGTTLGPASNTATATIPNLPAAPSSPTISGSVDANTSVVSLSWTNVSATAYDLYRNGSLLVAAITGTTYSDSTNTVPSSPTYYVKPYNTNAVGRTDGANSNTITVNVPLPPPPSAPSSPTLTGTATNSQQPPNYDGTANLSWTNVGATGYRVYRDGVLIISMSGGYSLGWGEPYDSTHTYKVVAYNQNAGGTTDAPDSNSVTLTIPRPNPPAPPPTPPTPTLAVSMKYQVATVSWTNVGCTGYRIYRNGSLLVTQPGATFTETRPAESFTSYYVIPYNDATNPGGTTTTVGSQSNTVTVLSKAIPPHSVGLLIG